MNPYKILNLEPGADKKEILKAVARAMREKKYSAKEIAIAQKTLLNPAKRVNDFFEGVDFSILVNKLTVREPDKKATECLNRPLGPDCFL